MYLGRGRLGDGTATGTASGGECVMDIASTAADNIVIGLSGLFATCLLNDAHLPNLTDFDSVEFSHDLYKIRTLRASDPSITDDVMTALKEQTTNLVLDNERDIRKVARALLEKKRLNEDDIVAMLGVVPAA